MLELPKVKCQLSSSLNQKLPACYPPSNDGKRLALGLLWQRLQKPHRLAG